MNPERTSLEQLKRLMVIAMEIVKQNGFLSLKHPLCQENPEIREEVKAILRSLNSKKENPQECLW